MKFVAKVIDRDKLNEFIEVDADSRKSAISIIREKGYLIIDLNVIIQPPSNASAIHDSKTIAHQNESPKNGDVSERSHLNKDVSNNDDDRENKMPCLKGRQGKIVTVIGGGKSLRRDRYLRHRGKKHYQFGTLLLLK